jgi:hypothetical protein
MDQGRRHPILATRQAQHHQPKREILPADMILCQAVMMAYRRASSRPIPYEEDPRQATVRLDRFPLLHYPIREGKVLISCVSTT